MEGRGPLPHGGEVWRGGSALPENFVVSDLKMKMVYLGVFRGDKFKVFFVVSCNQKL